MQPENTDNRLHVKSGFTLYKLLWFIIIFDMAALCIYLFLGYREFVDSDVGSRITFLEEMIQQRAFFPNDWFYPNEIHFLNPVVFSYILRLFLPPGFALNAFSSFLAVITLFLSFIILFKLFNVSRLILLLAIIPLLSGFSASFMTWIFGQNAYTLYVAVILLIVGIAYNVSFSSSQSSDVALWLKCIFLAALSCVYCIQGIRGVVTIIIPLILIMIILTIIDYRDNLIFIRYKIATIISVFAGSILGIILHLYLKSNLNVNDYLMNTLSFSFDWATFKNNFTLFYEGLFEQLSPVPFDYLDFGTFKGQISLYFILLAFISFVLLPIFIFIFKRKSVSKPLFFISLLYIASLLEIFCITIFTNLLRPYQQNGRYLLFTAVFGYLMLIVFLDELYKKNKFMHFVSLLLILSLPWQIMAFDNIRKSFVTVPDSAGNNVIFPAINLHDFLIQELEEKGIKYGYSSFWHASITTMLSNGNVKIRPILFIDGLPVPRLLLSAANWYQPQSFSGPTALIIGSEEQNDTSPTNMNKYLGEPKEIFEIGKRFTVYIYDYNIAKKWLQPQTKQNSRIQ